MRLSRGFVILAIVAALWGAPSTASAAVNELRSPQVSPSSGSVTTVFTFRVRYEGGFPAATVGVTVAGLTVPMGLESGSLTTGWWSGSGALPVGAWSTTFRATAARGPAATVAGPAVTVAAPATPPPATAEPTPSTTGAMPESAPTDPTAPPAAAAPPPEETAATAAIGTPQPAAPGQHAMSPGSNGAAPPEDGPVAGPGPAGADDDEGETPVADGVPAALPFTVASTNHGATRMRPDATTERSDAQATTDDLVANVLLLGLAGVASVAIVGTLLLVASRRRGPERAPANAAPDPAPSAAEDAAMRRMAFKDRGRAADDPILAALGVDDEMAARRAIRRSLRETPDDAKHPARRVRER
jgi:hypothetical protein